MKWPVVTPVMNIVIGFPNGLTFVPRYTEVYSFTGIKNAARKSKDLLSSSYGNGILLFFLFPELWQNDVLMLVIAQEIKLYFFLFFPFLLLFFFSLSSFDVASSNKVSTLSASNAT